METSSPGSRISAAAIDSSSDRLAWCLPGACDRTTVSRCRLIDDSRMATRPCQITARVDRAATGEHDFPGILLPHLPLQDALSLVPVRGKEVMIALGIERRTGVAGHLEQPPPAVSVHIDLRRVLEHILVDRGQSPSDRSEQVGHRLRRLDVADLLLEGNRVPRIHRPIEEVNILHEPDRVRSEPKAVNPVAPWVAPHVVTAIPPVRRQDRGEFAHQERQGLRHQVYRVPLYCGSKNAGRWRSIWSSPAGVVSMLAPATVNQPSAWSLSRVPWNSSRISTPYF